MKKFFLLLGLLLPLSLFAQTNAPLPQPGPIRFLRNQSWSLINGTTSSNGVVFTWTPISQLPYTCVSIANNNPINAHVFSYITEATHDATVNPNSIFTTSPPNRWYITSTLTGGQTTSVAAGSVITLSVPTAGAAQLALQLFNSTVQAGTPDTLDVLAVDSPSPCQISQLNNIGGVPKNACNNTFQANTATATSTLISVTVSGAGGAFSAMPKWHVCAYAISGAAATTSAKVAFFTSSAGGSCAGSPGAANSWAVTIPVGAPNFSLSNSPEIFELPGTGALCFNDGGTTTGTTFTVSYDFW